MALTFQVTIGLIAGLLLGLVVSATHIEWLARVPAMFEPVGTLFVNAIRLGVIPLVISGLIAGIAGGGEDTRAIRKLGGRALALMISILLLSCVLTLFAAPILLSGLHLDDSVIARLKESAANEIVHTSPPTLAQWVTDLVPANIFKAATDGALLPLLIVAAGFGLALTRVAGQRRAVVVSFFQGINDAFMAVMTYVLKLAPIGVFALALPFGARMGTAAAGAFAFYTVVVSGETLALAIGVLYPAAIFWGGTSLPRFIKAAAPSQAVALSSRSSLVSLPAVYEGARRGLAIPENVSNVVLPLAVAIFRVTVPIVHITGVLFLSRIYGIAIHPGQLATIALMTAALSMTAPGIPAGGVLVIAPILAYAHVPVAGVGILLALDTIPDMFKTAANVTSYLSVCCILSRGRIAGRQETIADGVASPAR